MTSLAETFQAGDGATISIGSDRYAATVIRVTRCTVTVREDHATRVDSNGQSEIQEYEYSENPAGRVMVFRESKGLLKCKGSYTLRKGRSSYRDPSF